MESLLIHLNDNKIGRYNPIFSKFSMADTALFFFHRCTLNIYNTCITFDVIDKNDVKKGLALNSIGYLDINVDES